MLKDQLREEARLRESRLFPEPEPLEPKIYLKDHAVNFLIKLVMNGEKVSESYRQLVLMNWQQGTESITEEFIDRAKKREYYNPAGDKGEESMLGILQTLKGDMVDRLKKNRVWNQTSLIYYSQGSVGDVLNKLYRVVALVNDSYQLEATLKKVKQLEKKNTKLETQIKDL